LLSFEHDNGVKVLTNFKFITDVKFITNANFRDISRLTDVLKSKNEENESYLSEIEVSFQLSNVDVI
jgi:hypothetical protein